MKSRKQMMKEQVLPLIQENQLVCKKFCTELLEFANKEDTFRISYEIRSRFGLAAPFMGQVGRVREFYLRISMKLSGRWFLVHYRMLSVPVEDPWMCPDEEAFQEVLTTVNDIVFSSIVPMLQRILANETIIRTEYYELLSKQPQALAEQFAARHQPTGQSLTACLSWCESWLNGRKPANIELRPGEFEENMQEYVGLAAYIGELFCQHRNAKWRWVENLDGKGLKVFAVSFMGREGEYNHSFDVLGNMLNYWNLTPDLKIPFIDETWLKWPLYRA